MLLERAACRSVCAGSTATLSTKLGRVRQNRKCEDHLLHALLGVKATMAAPCSVSSRLASRLFCTNNLLELSPRASVLFQLAQCLGSKGRNVLCDLTRASMTELPPIIYTTGRSNAGGFGTI